MTQKNTSQTFKKCSRLNGQNIVAYIWCWIETPGAAWLGACVTGPVTVLLTHRLCWKLQVTETESMGLGGMCLNLWGWYWVSHLVVSSVTTHCSRNIHIVSVDNGTCDCCKFPFTLNLELKERIWQQLTSLPLSRGSWTWREKTSSCSMEREGILIDLLFSTGFEYTLMYTWAAVWV